MTSKVCLACTEEKELEQFHRRTRALDKTINGDKNDIVDDVIINNHKKIVKQFEDIVKFKEDLKLAIRSRATFERS